MHKRYWAERGERVERRYMDLDEALDFASFTAPGLPPLLLLNSRAGQRNIRMLTMPPPPALTILRQREETAS